MAERRKKIDWNNEILIGGTTRLEKPGGILMGRADAKILSGIE